MWHFKKQFASIRSWVISFFCLFMNHYMFLDFFQLIKNVTWSELDPSPLSFPLISCGLYLLRWFLSCNWLFPSSRLWIHQCHRLELLSDMYVKEMQTFDEWINWVNEYRAKLYNKFQYSQISIINNF